MVIVPFQSLVDSVEKLVQSVQSPVHLAESAAPSGSSRLHSSMNFGSVN